MEYKQKHLNKKDMQKILDDFYDITGIRVAFLDDFEELSTGREKSSCKFCNLIRKHKEIDVCCIESDKNALETAKRINDLYLYKCHMGLWEAVVPIIISGSVAGYLMLGQVKCEKDSKRTWENTEKFLVGKNISSKELNAIKTAYENKKVFTKKKLKASASMLELIAKYVMRSDIVSVYDMEIIEKVKKQINENYMKDISTSTLSKEFDISSSYLSSLFKKETGITVTECLTKKRMEKAKKLLTTSSYTIREISEKIGYSDQNYFSRKFKKETNKSPTEYRDIKE